MKRPASDGFIIVAGPLGFWQQLSAFVSIYAAYVVNTAAGLSIYDNRLRSQQLASAACRAVAYRVVWAKPRARRLVDLSFRLGPAAAAR